MGGVKTNQMRDCELGMVVGLYKVTGTLALSSGDRYETDLTVPSSDRGYHETYMESWLEGRPDDKLRVVEV